VSSVQVNGINISYDVMGEGPPIILIHGFASNRIVNWEDSGWYEYFLSKGRQVIALDLRGHGESQKLYGIGDYTLDVISTDILALMDHLEISKADIMGYSMGAWLTAYFLGNNPERFTSGVLCGIGRGILSFKTHSENIARALTAKAPDLIIDPFLKLLRTFAEGLNNDLRALVACNLGVNGQGAPPLDKIPHPVLIVAGEKDGVAGPPDVLVDSITNSTLAMIPGKDHTTLVSAKLFKEEVGKFFENSK
jgi:pimeloyl-ACP methyl ester carboxylesterase